MSATHELTLHHETSTGHWVTCVCGWAGRGRPAPHLARAAHAHHASRAEAGLVDALKSVAAVPLAVVDLCVAIAEAVAEPHPQADYMLAGPSKGGAA